MTSSYGPDTSLPPTESSNWELDLDVMLGRKDGSLLMDKDTFTSLASKETLCWGRTHWGNGIEEHEIGPSPTNNLGPPFMVGDIILCDIPGQLWGMDPKVICFSESETVLLEIESYTKRQILPKFPICLRYNA